MTPDLILQTVRNVELSASGSTNVDELRKLIKDEDRTRVVVHKFMMTKFSGVSGEISSETEDRQVDTSRTENTKTRRFNFLSICCRKAED